MLRNYLKIALRNLRRNKSITGIKLAGLIAGFTGVILIIAYVRFELSYDQFNTKASRIYRIEVKDTVKDKTSMLVPVGLIKMLNHDFPDVKSSVILSEEEWSAKAGKHLIDTRILKANSSFFNIFTEPLIEGNPKTALKQPFTAVISKKVAQSLFDNVDPINKTVIIGTQKKHPYLITGVMKDIPVNSHFHGDIILSISNKNHLISAIKNGIAYTYYPHYILLSPKASPALLEKTVLSDYQKYNVPLKEHLFLMPLKKIHLYSHLSAELEPNGNILYIYIFSLIALLILGIACINFINLTTAGYLKRTKEVGVRKVLGANNRQLHIQFLSEGVILFTIAAVISILLAVLLIPWFSSSMGIPLTVPSTLNKNIIVFAILLAVLMAVLGGFYPAIFLSRLSPSLVLRGTSLTGRAHIGVRKSLVLTQFVISIALVIVTIFIYGQLHYIQTKDLGFNEKNVLFFPDGDYGSNYGAFRNELLGYQGIVNMSIAGWRPGKSYSMYVSWSNEKDTTKSFSVGSISTDFDFLKTLQIPLLVGRDFSRKYGSDGANINSMIHRSSHSESAVATFMNKGSIILNESAVKELGLKHPVGKQLRLRGTVIGVVKDFNGLSLYKSTGPIAINARVNNRFGWLFIRVKPQNEASTISYIHKVWKKYYPDQIFKFSFLDQYLQSQYKTPQHLGDLCMAFTLLAILISCLGLFGLALFDTERRTKEIAIRKVFGASVKDILQLINRNYVLLVMIANIVAWPVAWIAANQWLDNFAYRIDVSFMPFMVATIVSVLLTILTVSIQAWRTATAYPAERLRNE